MKAFHGYGRQCAPPNYHGDHLESAQIVTNGTGEIYEHIEYTPYGELWVDHTKRIGSEEGTPFRFTGKEYDEETGLYYYGARYLDPKTSRWISTDPAMAEYIPGAPINDEAKKRNQNLPGMGGVFNYVNLHVYHYAGNNPVKLIDPDGRTTIVNNTKHWIIIKGENSQIHAVKPGETYKTDDHQGLKEIDGILMHDGSTYKTNNGNKDSTFTVSENSEGSLSVQPDFKTDVENIETDRLKNLWNVVCGLFGKEKLEKSGMYTKGDGSIVGDSWWVTMKAKSGLEDSDVNNVQSWDSKLAGFRKQYPDGVK